MNWHFNEAPEKDGTYQLFVDYNYGGGWVNYGETSYTAEGGWNTRYDEDGALKDCYALALNLDVITAWAEVEDFQQFLELILGFEYYKKALTANMGE